ncbi:MAG: type IV pilin protein [Candidatus Berkiellales bacterium]
MKKLNSISGFSLLEMLLTLSIVAILATIAYPSYTHQMIKYRRVDGQMMLFQVAAALEIYFSEHNTYQNASLENMTVPNTQYYLLEISELSALSYTISAIPKGPQANDSCGTLTLTHTQVKGPNAACWS